MPLFSLCQDIGSLLPPLERLEQWRLEEKPSVYTGDDLFELINGGAEIYHEYGFVRVVSADYVDAAQTHIQLEIYEMSDASAAYGIFSLSQQSVEWKSEYGRVSASSKDYISFWKDRYYVLISWESRQHADAPQMSKLAAIVDQAIAEDPDPPELVRSFDAAAQAKRTVYLRGNLALSNFYYFDYKNIFEITEGIACTPGQHHRIVFRYDDELRAQGVLASARQMMSNNKRFSDIAITYQGFTCRDNKGNRIMIRQVGRFIAVLVALDPSVSLTPLMDEVMGKIEDNL